MKQLVIILFSASLAFALAGCQNETPKASEQPAAPQAAATKAPQAAAATTMGQSGSVTETMDAGPYTYVQVDTGSEKIWAAAPKFTVKVGDQVVVPKGLTMKDYHSPSLNRDFPVVYFVESILVGGADVAMAAPANPMPDSSSAPNMVEAKVDLSGIQPAAGGNTVQQLYENRTELAGKNVKVRGKVVKFNPDIMGKNWLHIQDGTGAEGTNDVAVTTAAMAKIGDTVLIDGTMTIDRKFGANYQFDILIDDAQVTVE